LLTANLSALVDHTGDDDGIACRAEDIAASIVIPAVASWEAAHGLRRFSLAHQGAAGLPGTILEARVDRQEIKAAVARVLDDIEQRIAQERALGGPA
jgi:hypothetical protein